MRKRLITLLAVLSFAASQYAPAVYAVNEETPDVFTDAAADTTISTDDKSEDAAAENSEKIFESELLSEENEDAELAEDMSGTCGDGVNWSLYSNGTLAIWGSGVMNDYTYPAYTPWDSKKDLIKNIEIEEGVTSIGIAAFSGCENLVDIIIPTSVTNIGAGAFTNCSSLNLISIPNSITSIKEWTFDGCSSLHTINISKSITSIGDHAFYRCTNLKDIYYGGTESDWSSINIRSYNAQLLDAERHYAAIGDDNLTWIIDSLGTLTISGSGAMADYRNDLSYNAPWYSNRSNIKNVIIEDGVTSIGDFAFSDCINLSSISIPNSVTSIGDRAFYYCSSLSSISIPNSVTSIGDSAFSRCSSLNSISIPNSVTSIESGAFFGCSSLSSISIPNSVTSIENNVFFNCISLTQIDVDNENLNYSSENGILFNKNKETIIAYPAGKADTSYSIPNSVTSIGSFAFSGCSSLSSISIPDSVTSIGGDAFSGCSSLSSISIPDSVTSIGSFAFSGCSSLSSISIPDSVTSIGDSTFEYCSSINSISIPNSVTSIGDSTFEYCSSISSINIPNSVTSIGDRAFYECTALTDVYYEGTESEWSSISIGIYNAQLLDAERHYSAIGGVCGDNLTWVIDGSGTLTISGSGAMADYSSETDVPWYSYRNDIKNVIIEEGVTSIGNNAFYNCSSLSSISIPNSITIIGDSAFERCTVLSGISIPNGVTSIGKMSFYECGSINSINIPASVNSIGYAAFVAGGLTQIDADEENKSYSSENGVLFDKDKKTIIAYPAGRTDTSYTVPDSVTSIGSGAFGGCAVLKSISIPIGVTSIGDFAFDVCNALTDVYYDGTESKWSNINIGSHNDSLINATIHYPTIVANGSCGDNVTWTLDSVGTLTISGSGDMTNHSYETDIPNYIDSIKNVIIEEGVTSIVNQAFSGCSSLSSISIPNSVTSIGSGAFEYCSSLSNISIPNSVTSIEGGAFSYCSSLNSISIPNSVTSIGNYAFSRCSSLNSISIPNSVTSIGEYAFYGCSSLSSISIPNSVTSIGKYAFMYCSSLTQIDVDNENLSYTSENGILFDKNKETIIAYPAGKADTSYSIPNSVTNIGNSAFYDCSSLISISIPNSVTSIGRYAFYDCSSLKTVNYFGRSTQWSNISIGSDNDPLTNATKNYLLDDDIFTSPTQSTDSYNIIDGGEYHYWEFKPEQSGTYIFKTTAKNAVICLYDADLNPIGSEAENNAEIIFDANKDKSFYLAVRRKNGGNTGTIDVQLTRRYNINYNANGGSFTPESQTVKYGEKLKISSSTPSRDGYIFCGWAVSSNASAAEYMPGTEVEFDNDYILYAVWKKEEKITSGTDNGILWNFTNNGVLTLSGSGAIADYTKDSTPWKDLSEEITAIMVIDGITVIGANAFAGLANVKTVSIAKSVNQINDGAFEGCTGITSITLPENMTGGIGSGAFKDCTAIQNMTVPSKVSSISEGAFEGCTGLLSIKLPFIGSQAGSKNNSDTFGYIFKENVPERLTSVEITNETNIPENAFAGMDKLVNIKVNSEAKTIGSGAFDGCKALKEFIIPSGVTSIGDNTFRGCESALSIPIPSVVKSIGSGAFDGCKSLKEVTIPDGIKDLYEYTFRGCSSLKKVVIPNSVDVIGVSVLEGCTGIIDLNIPFVGANKTVTDETSTEHRIGYLFGTEDNSKIPPSVTKIEITDTSKSNYIPAEAFKNCGNIEDIIIDGGRTIGYGAFANCKNLRNLYIPKSVTGIEKGNEKLNKNSILEGCVNLETLTVPFIGTNRNDAGTETSVLGGFFGYDDSSIIGKITQYYTDTDYHNYKIPSTLKNISVLNQTTIPIGAFSSCEFLEKATIVTGAVLNKKAFSGCTSLKTVTLPQDMTEIGEEAFAECEKLENINIPEKVKTIGSNAFYNARNLKNVTMPESVKEIADDVFNGTNIASGDAELMSDKLTITCARPSFAYDYAVRKGINTRIVSSDKLNVKKTSTTVNLLSTENYLFDVTDTHKLNGVLHVEFYNDKLEKYKEETRTADDVEYRIEVTAEDMKDFSFARVYIADENGIAVTTEDELITKDNGTIPEIPESDIVLTYRNGTVKLRGKTKIKNGTVLAEAIYDGGRLVSVETYPVTSNDEEIEVSGKKGAKYMLWESLSGMKQLAEPVTAN